MQQVERTLDARLEAHKLYFLDNLGKYSLLPEAIATSPYLRELLRRPDSRNVHAANLALAETAANVGSDRIWVMDGHGTTLADSMWKDRNSIVGRNYAYRAYFKQAIAGQTGHFIGVGSTSQIVGYFISRPVVVDGKVRGVVTIRLSDTFKTFEAILWNNWKEHGELALMADEHGILFMSAIPDWTFKVIAPVHENVLTAVRDSRQYGDRQFVPVRLKKDEILANGMRFIRFDELPGRTFIQKSYDMPETGGRTYLHVDAREYWNAVLLYSGAALLAAIVLFLIMFVILERWRYQMKLVEAAIRDPLTGLYTRLYMQEWLGNAINTHARHPEQGFSLLLFDVDRFKNINDTYGHVIGDEVLKGIADIIAGAIRAEDLAVRFGGEEIAVFARLTDLAEVCLLGERIRERVEQLGVQTSRGHIAATLSGGIASHVPGEAQTTMFDRADKKLYEAKTSGRNRICSH